MKCHVIYRSGLPSVSVPVARVSSNAFSWTSTAGLPLGLQLIGRSFDETTLLRAASALEAMAQFSPLPFRTTY
jgi:aspartyl-tRNA(Asn)/glutamyl-tRNA(Gln) amidotransferase subunit A